MNTNEKKNQRDEPAKEASDLLMDSLLQNVATNHEGADDDVFLDHVEMMIDADAATDIQPQSDGELKSKRRLSGWMPAGIAAAAVIGISTVLAVVSIDRLKFQRQAMEDVTPVYQSVDTGEYVMAETSPTTADQLAQAKRVEQSATVEKDTVIAKIGHEAEELKLVERELSFVETKMEETLGEKKEIDLAIRKLFPDAPINATAGGDIGYAQPITGPTNQLTYSGDITTDLATGSGGEISISGNGKHVQFGHDVRRLRSEGGSDPAKGLIEMNSAPVPAGATGVQTSPGQNKNDSFVQIGHGGRNAGVDGEDRVVRVGGGFNGVVPVATASPDAAGRKIQPVKKLFKQPNESNVAVPAAADSSGIVLERGIGATISTGYETDYVIRGGEVGGKNVRGIQARSKSSKSAELALAKKPSQRTWFVDAPDDNWGDKTVRPQNLVDNPWKSPLGEPLSTFSIDVDTASWTNIRGMLERGVGFDQIPPDSVRVEEMINYFDWKYPQPKADHPFGFAVESAQCPWNADTQLLRVAIQGKDVKRDARPPANLVFLLDVSGSMNQQNKLPLVQKSISLMVEEMNQSDCISIVVYAGAEGVALHPTKGNEQAEIMDALKRLKAGGSTNGGAGINLAYKMASKNFIKDGVNRVILCTDGDFNVGLTGTETLTQLVERKAKRERVFLSVCGFGNDNLNDAMLESITNKGNGTYYFIDTIAEARKVFLKDMMATLVTIAKDVKIQVEFNPGQVKAYRLIGYANRRLAAKDFEDDRVDAGEIGAGHSVTAFYEVVPSASQRDPLREVTSNLRYQKDAAPKPAPQPERVVVESPELALLKLRYKEPDGDVSKLIEQPVMPNGQDWRNSTEDFRFASAVALFGMKLRGNDSVKNVELPEIIDLAESGIGTDPHGYRAEFLKLLKAAK